MIFQKSFEDGNGISISNNMTTCYNKNWTNLFKTWNNNTLNNVFLNSQILNSVLTV